MFRTAIKVTDVGLKLHHPKGGGYGMVIQLGLSASLLAGRIAETPLPQLPPGPG